MSGAARRGLLAGSVLLLVATITGCTSTKADQTTGGFVAGDGTVTFVDSGKRTAAPAVEGESLDGEQISLADEAGKTVVLNVWGSWCGDCRVEAPELSDLDDELGDDVAFLGLDIRDTRSAAKAYNKRFDISYPSIFDPSSTQLLGFGDSLPAVAVPTTYVIDPDGKVAARILGSTTTSTLEGLVEDVQDGR